MILQEKERKIVYLFDFFDKNPNVEVKIVFENETINRAKLDTMYEDEIENDEFNVLVLLNIEKNELFEISYHNPPIHVFYNDEEIK